MRFAAIVLLVVTCASAQGARPGRRGPSRDNSQAEGPSAESLLRIVHDEAQQLSPTDRAAVISRAVLLAQRVEPDLVLPWTEEIFNLAPQVSEDRRASLEWNPVMAVANRDVEAAVQLLERMDAPSKTMLDAGMDPRTQAAVGVFAEYWGRHGRRFRGAVDDDDEDDDLAATQKAQTNKRLERMRAVAARLGSTGVYPYSAFTAPLTALKTQDPAAQETLFADLLGAFRASPGRYADVTEFNRMLMNARGVAPTAFFREALTMAVAAIDRIPVDNLPNMTFSIRGQSGSGQLSNAASIQLMRLIPLIKDIDPALAEQVLDQHKDLAQFEQSRGTPGAVVSATISGGANANRNPQRQLAPVRALAQNSSSQGAKLFAQQITDPAARAAANAEIAASLAGENPQEAALYLGQASQTLGTVDDPASQLLIVASLARAAFETGDRASAAQYSERGFRLGEDVVRADYDANPDKAMMSLKGVSELTNLVNTGMRIDPAGTVSRVQAIRYPLLRENLLLTAAESADARRNLRGAPVRTIDSTVRGEVTRSVTVTGGITGAVTRPPE